MVMSKAVAVVAAAALTLPSLSNLGLGDSSTGGGAPAAVPGASSVSDAVALLDLPYEYTDGVAEAAAASEALALGKARHHMQAVAENHAVGPVLVVLVELGLVGPLLNAVEVGKEVGSRLPGVVFALTRFA